MGNKIVWQLIEMIMFHLRKEGGERMKYFGEMDAVELSSRR